MQFSGRINSRLTRRGRVWPGLARYGHVRLGTVWCGLVGHGLYYIVFKIDNKGGGAW